MLDISIKGTTSNVSKIKTNDRSQALHVKIALDEMRAKYTTCITYQNNKISEVLFIVFGSKRHNLDILSRFLS